MTIFFVIVNEKNRHSLATARTVPEGAYYNTRFLSRRVAGGWEVKRNSGTL
jgi:hypothetical protein